MADVERRERRRFSLSLPVTVRVIDEAAGSEIRGLTRDVSSAGAFIFLQAPQFPPCESVELTLELPPEITLVGALKVRCRARVLRVERSPEGVIGIAVQISAFDFLPSTWSGTVTPPRH